MRKLLYTLLLAFTLFSNGSFAQEQENEIFYLEGNAKVITNKANLFTVFFIRTTTIKTIFVPETVLDQSGISKLEQGKDYNFQIQSFNGKYVVYYVAKTTKQKTLDIRQAQDSISVILRPKSI